MEQLQTIKLPLQLRNKIVFFNAETFKEEEMGLFRGVVNIQIHQKVFVGIAVDVRVENFTSIWKRIYHAVVPKYKRMILLPSHGSLMDMVMDYRGKSFVIGWKQSKDEWIADAFPIHHNIQLSEDFERVLFRPLWYGKEIITAMLRLDADPIGATKIMQNVSTNLKDAIKYQVEAMIRLLYTDKSLPIPSRITELIKNNQWIAAADLLASELKANTKKMQSYTDL